MTNWPPLQENRERNQYGANGEVERPTDRFNEHRGALIFRDRFNVPYNYHHDSWQFAPMDGFFTDDKMFVRAMVEVKSRPKKTLRANSILNIRKWNQIVMSAQSNPSFPHYFIDQYEDVLLWSHVDALVSKVRETKLQPRVLTDSRSVQRSTSTEPVYLLPTEWFEQIDPITVQISDESTFVLRKLWSELVVAA